MAKHGKKTAHGSRGGNPLAKAEELLDARKWEEAAELLTTLTEQRPNNRDAWAMLGEALMNLEDARGLWTVARTLIRLEPAAEANWFNAVNVAMINGMPFSASNYAEEFISRFPDSPFMKDIRKQQEVLQQAIAAIHASSLTTPGGTDQDFRELEQATIALDSGDFDLAEQLSRATLARSPHLAAPANNLCLIDALRGNLEEAIRRARAVLDQHPGNIHALANLVQFYVRTGQREEAQRTAQELRQQPCDEAHLPKQIEGLTYLDDDEAVIRLFEKVNPGSRDQKGNAQLALAYHLAAVAYAHRGDDRQARQLWQTALKLSPDYAMAQANLDNLKKPVGERVRAFPFELRQWIPIGWIQDLRRAAQRGQSGEKALKSQMDKFLQVTPGLEGLLPVLFERGGEDSRGFALHVASAARLPLVRDFALSDHGTDAERMQAAQAATEFGLLARGQPVSMLSKGERRDLMMLAYEISGEPDRRKIPAAIQYQINTIHDVLIRGDYAKAETMAKEAVRKSPNEPTLWNYVVSSLQGQRKEKEAAELIRQMAERFPNYFFAKIALARLYVQEGQVEQAHHLLEPLLTMQKFHTSEFSALASANIELLMAEKQVDGAKSWIQMWEQFEPDSPNLGHYRRLLRVR